MSHVLLIGYMGAGKSTVAKLVAAKLGMPSIDLDAAIELAAGRTIAQLFAEEGEAAFRQLESEALMSLADEMSAVVACGGGVVTRAENRATLKALGLVVYLRVTAEEMLARVGEDPSRPLLAGGGGVLAATTLLEARESLYSAVADIVVDTVRKSPETVADEVVELIRGQVAS